MECSPAVAVVAQVFSWALLSPPATLSLRVIRSQPATAWD
jgi:hypothetical protein